MSEADPHHHATPRHRVRGHRVLKAVAICVAVVLVVVATGGFLAYQHLNKNITKEDITKQLGTDRPTELPKKKGVKYKAENILLLGSDTRQGQSGKKIGGATPGLSDTTILLHVSANRKLSYGVSLPRDAMVQRPACLRKGKGNGTSPAQLEQFNDAYAVGGAGCTVKTVEQLTGVRINHFIVIDFNGFKKVVNALGGVQVCVPEAVNDTTGHIQLKAGTYNVKGEQALDYVRVRHDIGTVENGDIGRMKRQQTFLASMANKAVSAKTLVNVPRLYKVLDAATKSLTTDPGLASVKKLTSMAQSLNGIGLNHIQFLTVPFEEYPPDHNRLQWAPSAAQLWKRINNDQPVGKEFQAGLTTAADNGGSTKKKGSTATPSPSTTAAAERAAELRRQNGLCA